MNKFLRVWLVWLVLTFAVVWFIFFYSHEEEARPPARAAAEVSTVPGKFVMAGAADGSGGVWMVAEDGVVSHFGSSVSGSAWRCVAATNEFGGGGALSVAVDGVGRLWVGHVNRGVSVFNGDRWQNYDIADGPIGERVNDIAVSPLDGSVWLATSAGLSRYSEQSKTWAHFTRHDGLPADQIQSVAVAKNGRVFVGTQCDGVAMADASEDYRRWKVAPVAPESSVEVAWKGLPSPLVNDVLVTKNGAVFVATDGGLAVSADLGATWRSFRGRDFAEKVDRREGGAPAGWVRPQPSELLLPEDYTTALAEDEGGVVWVGFRKEGALALDSKSFTLLHQCSPSELGGVDFVRGIIPAGALAPWVVSYGSGAVHIASAPDLLGRMEPPRKKPNLFTRLTQSPRKAVPGLPASAPAPVLAVLNELLREVESVPAITPVFDRFAAAMEDDWRTQGPWLGRYGKFHAVLCAMWSPKDDVWGAGWNADVGVCIGANHKPGDSQRYWIQWLHTNDNRVLEMTPTYLHSRVVKGYSPWELDRRSAEWNDNGGAYPVTQDGPHLYCPITIPPGTFILSLYNHNKDGHTGKNRTRDYEISIRPSPDFRTVVITNKAGTGTASRSTIVAGDFEAGPELARARNVDFWDGVYKRFIVTGPAQLTVKLDRNHSHNTMLTGVFLDLVDELPPPYFLTREAWEETQRGRKFAEAAEFRPAINEKEAVARITAAMREMPHRNPAWWAQNRRRIFLPLLRWHQAQNAAPNADHATALHALDFYERWEEQLTKLGFTTARAIERAIRWDLVTYDCARLGNKFVRDYIETHPEKFPNYGRLPSDPAPAR